MTAKPTWPPQSTPRLFVETKLAEGTQLRIDGAQAHYLIAVMRLNVGDPVKICDNQTGEWLCIAQTIGKRDLILSVKTHLRLREPVPDLWLLAAPIKKARLDMVVEKACELGVALYRPIITRRTIIDRVNADRLRNAVIEAAEQCGRTALLEIGEPLKLVPLLRDWPPDRTLYFADERGGEPFAPRQGPAAILIGPEGGFDDDERAAILALPSAIAISLGPRILRAETAAIAAVSVWMAKAGDW